MKTTIFRLAIGLGLAACGGSYRSSTMGYQVTFPTGTLSPEVYEEEAGAFRFSIARTADDNQKLVVFALGNKNGAPITDGVEAAAAARDGFVSSMTTGVHKFKCSRIANDGSIHNGAYEERFECPDYPQKTLRARFRGDESGIYMQIAMYRPESDYARNNVDQFFSTFRTVKRESTAPASLASKSIPSQAIERVVGSLE